MTTPPILQRMSGGNNRDIHWHPVQRCRPPCTMAGGGNVPPSTHMQISHISARSKNTSGDVIMYDDKSESCTMPITGRLACGDTMFLATDINSCASARAANVCNTCKFISSPSKSALYGVVHVKLRRNVLPVIIFTRWHMMDILWRDGCRLNRTRSPSRS